ncbi:MAG: ferrous iron transport protein A [Acutalibacteraceae bacterium]
MTHSPLIPLPLIPTGQQACVRHIGLTGSLYRRLLDLGLIEGTVVTPLQISPSGDPTAYFIRGTVIALRRRDACHILVTPCKGGHTKEGFPNGTATAAPHRCAGRKPECRKKHDI